jgi:hypothetical protein
MVHSQIAVGAHLQLWRVATNILNKQLQPTNRGWSSSMGLTSHCKSKIVTKVSKSLRLGQILWINELSSGKWT